MKNKILIIGGVLVLALIVMSSLGNKGEAPGTSTGQNGGNTTPPTGKTPPPPGGTTPPTTKTPPPPTTKVPPRVEQQPPQTPTDFTVTLINSGKIQLRLKVANLAEVDGFNFTQSSRADFIDGKTVELIAGADPEPLYFTFFDVTVSPGNTYYYRVTAYNEAGDSPASPARSITIPPISGPVVPDPVSISISGFKYEPQSITVKKGTKVIWTNLDSSSHTVTGDTLAGPTSSLLPEGGTYSYTFNTPGTYPYHCSPHPSMTGTITVTD